MFSVFSEFLGQAALCHVFMIKTTARGLFAQVLLLFVPLRASRNRSAAGTARLVRGKISHMQLRAAQSAECCGARISKSFSEGFVPPLSYPRKEKSRKNLIYVLLLGAGGQGELPKIREMLFQLVKAP